MSRFNNQRNSTSYNPITGATSASTFSSPPPAPAAKVVRNTPAGSKTSRDVPVKNSFFVFSPPGGQKPASPRTKANIAALNACNSAAKALASAEAAKSFADKAAGVKAAGRTHNVNTQRRDSASGIVPGMNTQQPLTARRAKAGSAKQVNASTFNLVTGAPSSLNKHESEFVNPIVRTTSSGKQVKVGSAKKSVNTPAKNAHISLKTTPLKGEELTKTLLQERPNTARGMTFSRPIEHSKNFLQFDPHASPDRPQTCRGRSKSALLNAQSSVFKSGPPSATKVKQGKAGMQHKKTINLFSKSDSNNDIASAKSKPSKRLFARSNSVSIVGSTTPSKQPASARRQKSPGINPKDSNTATPIGAKFKDPRGEYERNTTMPFGHGRGKKRFEQTNKSVVLSGNNGESAGINQFVNSEIQQNKNTGAQWNTSNRSPTPKKSATTKTPNSKKKVSLAKSHSPTGGIIPPAWR